MPHHAVTITDERRRAFLDALDNADDITPTDWECMFLESTIFLDSFTPAQRNAIDRMIGKYGSRLAW